MEKNTETINSKKPLGKMIYGYASGIGCYMLVNMILNRFVDESTAKNFVKFLMRFGGDAIAILMSRIAKAEGERAYDEIVQAVNEIKDIFERTRMMPVEQ